MLMRSFQLCIVNQNLAHVDFDLFQAVDGMEEIELGKESIGTTHKGENFTSSVLLTREIIFLIVQEALGTSIQINSV
jgi:hypothetical protein